VQYNFPSMELQPWVPGSALCYTPNNLTSLDLIDLPCKCRVNLEHCTLCKRK
jgi:hypothetical protein